MTADLLPRGQATVGVLGAHETGTFVVQAGRSLGSRPELVAVLGQAGRLRTIYRGLRLPLGAEGSPLTAARSRHGGAEAPDISAG